MQKKHKIFSRFFFTLIFECDTLIFLRKEEALFIIKKNVGFEKMLSFELIFDGKTK
jgi:hypothetical protein